MTNKLPRRLFYFFIVFFIQMCFIQNTFGSEVENFTLKNGIKTVFKKVAQTGNVSIHVFTPVSVINETPNNYGITSLMVQLMMTATKNRSKEKFITDIQDIGKEIHYVLHDYACVNLDCSPGDFEKALDILADITINPTFDEKEISFAKKANELDLNSQKDNITCIVEDEFRKLFYQGASYSVSVFGTKKTVEKISREDLVKWHEYCFNTSNIVISVVGDIDKKIVKNSLEKYFASVPNGKKFEKPVFDIKHAESIKKEIKSKFNQAYICIGFPAPDMLDKDYAAIWVISDILGGNSSSKLFVELREKHGLSYDLETYYNNSIMKESYFLISIGLDKKNIELVLNKINEILKEFCYTGITEQKLKDAKMFRKGEYIRGLQTISAQSDYYGYLKTLNYNKNFLDDLEKVTVQDVLRVANRIFSQKSVTVIVD